MKCDYCGRSNFKICYRLVLDNRELCFCDTDCAERSVLFWLDMNLEEGEIDGKEEKE